ncbi:MAG: hypothetical protein HY606_06980 [Planctomycetes bacterium]|nr:hypothetical protein [Planctomycetota bacterium]
MKRKFKVAIFLFFSGFYLLSSVIFSGSGEYYTLNTTDVTPTFHTIKFDSDSDTYYMNFNPSANTYNPWLGIIRLAKYQLDKAHTSQECRACHNYGWAGTYLNTSINLPD